MKFKDFIYYVLLVIVAGLFLVLSFSYFAKDKESGSVGGIDRVSVDLASGLINSWDDSVSYEIADIESYDFLEIYFYSNLGSSFTQIVVSDYLGTIIAGDTFEYFLSFIGMNIDQIISFSFEYNLITHTFEPYLAMLKTSVIEPINSYGYFYFKGVNYV